MHHGHRDSRRMFRGGTYSVCVREGHRYRLYYQDGQHRSRHRGDFHSLAEYATHALRGTYEGDNEWRARPKILCYVKIDEKTRDESQSLIYRSSLSTEGLRT